MAQERSGMQAFLCPFLDQWSMRDIHRIQLESVEDLSRLEDTHT